MATVRGVGFCRIDGHEYFFNTLKTDEILFQLRDGGLPVSTQEQPASKAWPHNRSRQSGRVTGAYGVARDGQAPPLMRPASRAMRQLRRAGTRVRARGLAGQKYL